MIMFPTGINPISSTSGPANPELFSVNNDTANKNTMRTGIVFLQKKRKKLKETGLFQFEPRSQFMNNIGDKSRLEFVSFLTEKKYKKFFVGDSCQVKRFGQEKHSN